LIGVVAITTGLAVARAQPGADPVKSLMDAPAVKAALAAAKAAEPQTLQDQIRYCEIPAREFREEVRGRELQRVFQEIGLDNVRVDKVGNVLGSYAGRAARPHLVIAAHLDTVFPEGTDVKIKHDSAILRGPGIGDDCRGLAVLTTIAREIKKAGVKNDGTITFVANVGEEGLGDLRGVKELFNATLKEGSDRQLHFDRWHRRARDQRRRRQPPLQDYVQGPGRPQLRRIRHGEPDGRHGPGDREDSGHPGAEAAEDDVQRRTDRRRHVGELHSVRRLDGARHAVVRSGVARGGGCEHSEGDRRGGRR
jgi:hypothetical protein